MYYIYIPYSSLFYTRNNNAENSTLGHGVRKDFEKFLSLFI